MPIRLRLAAAFALATAVLFAIGGWLFASALSSAQLTAIDSQLTAQLSRASVYLPGSAPQGTATSGTAAADRQQPGDYLIQVIDAAGRVRGAGPEAGTAPLLSTAELSQARQAAIQVTVQADEENTRVAAAPLAGHSGWVAVAGMSLETYEATMSQVERDLVIAGIAAVAVTGFGAYWLARTALSPVERMRRQVAEISSHDEDAVIAVPATRDEIAALAGTMNELLGRLQRALARQRAFVADASHELRTPLAVLRGELELAGRPGRTRAELAAAVRAGGAEAERLSRITDALLLLARGDEDALSLQLERTDIAKLLASSAAAAESRLAAAGLTARVAVPAGLHAEVDEDRVRAAVDNLVGNALRFAPRGTAVVLAAWADGPDLGIEVKDYGPGFPAEFLPHAFERFRRPDGGRTRDAGGAGLGLAIVQAIAAAHGGTATAVNRPEGGATVLLRFPGAIRGRQM
jgi:two-component system OmpR family sensor kinase